MENPKKEDETKVALDIAIPVSIFTDRSIAVLEALVEYLKDDRGLSYHQIAELLNRDDRTVWTCYNRAKKKRKHGKK